ncbi:MAG: hypothetical protein H0W72_14285 [Planctomycetes bacterium]|nr:hypothetical protein [Planctomycetota bacterium]
MLRWLIVILAVAAPCAAEIAGVPEPPRPGPFPDRWLVWSNDALGGEIGENTDDFRTTSFSGGALLGRRFLLAIDSSNFTDKARSAVAPARSDELTATAGILLFTGQATTAAGGPWLALGGGVRLHGNLGGEALQNGWHDILGVDRVDYIAYESDSGIAGLGYATGVLPVWSTPIDLARWLRASQLGLELEAAGLLTTSNERQSLVGARLAVNGSDGAGWFGVRQRWNGGDASTPTAATVADHEAGTWLAYGASFGGWFIDGGVNLDDNATVGRLGWMWRRASGRAQKSTIDRLEGELLYVGGGALGVRLRWRPRWMQRQWGQVASWFGDYRFGRTGQIWDDSIVAYRQPVVGFELAANRGDHHHLRLEPFALAGIGFREERLVTRGPITRYRDESAVRAVLLGGAGLRAVWGKASAPGRTVRYSLSVECDGWLPTHSADVVNVNGRDTYLEPGVAATVALGALVDW